MLSPPAAGAPEAEPDVEADPPLHAESARSEAEATAMVVAVLKPNFMGAFQMFRWNRNSWGMPMMVRQT